MKLYLVIIKVLFVGALFIISNNNLHLADSHQREVFFGLYSNWFSDITLNSVKMVGAVVTFKWLPDKNIDISSLNLSGS
jgi:hypothetical protein